MFVPRSLRRPRSTVDAEEDTISGAPLTDIGTNIGDGRRRAVVEGVTPLVDGVRVHRLDTPLLPFNIPFTPKSFRMTADVLLREQVDVAGDRVVVEADAFADGNDVVLAALRHRAPGGPWTEVPMEPLGNDRWRASFVVDELGRHEYTVAAWTDHWVTWRMDIVKRLEAGQETRPPSKSTRPG